MAKIINLRAPESMRLHDLPEREIEKYVTEQADRILSVLPEEIRPAGVNTVVIDALRPGTAADPGVWAEWSRACCGHRSRIEDFEEPVLQEWTADGSLTHIDARGQHVESQLRHTTLEYPDMHQAGGAGAA
ncbi:hypothetical protein ACFO0M_08105 [Micromonospora mangrovi]|uniref:Uncharacterized protein n=2 Tax=Micromonospora TaxID=1873 RepID=A0AAU8HCE7_9ACTN